MVRETRYLWIGNLPEKASEERITEHFKRYGKIQSVKLHPKKEGDSDLSATVAFMDIRSASKAHNSKNELDDKTLCTNFAEPTASGSIVTRTCEVTSQLQREAPAASSAPAARSATTTNTAAPERGRFEPAHAGRGTPTAKRDGLADDRTEHGNRSERSTHSEDRLEHTDDYYLTRERGRERERFPRERNFSQRTPDGQTSTQRTDDADAKRFHRRKLNQASSAATRQSSLESQGSAKTNNKKNAANSRQFRNRKSRSRSAGSTSSSMSSGSSSSSRSRSPSSSKARRSQLASKIEGVVPSSASVKDETTSESGGERKNLGICITRLPLRSTDTSLRDGLFHAYKKHGKVTSVVIQGETEARFAVVSFKKSEDAKKAQEASNEMTFFGSKISVTSHPGYEVEDSEFRPPEAELDEFHPKATRTLFVGNLEKDISPTQLKEIFKEFGEIIDIDIKKQGAVTAYAFVQYSDISSVVKALKKMDGESIGPNKIKLGFGKSMPTTCVWIDGVADTVTEKFLCRQFGRYGPVSHAVLDKHIGRALIYFDTLDFAQHSVSEMRGRALAGKKIQIDFASRDCQTSFFDKMQRSGQLRPGERPDERAIRTNPKFPVTPTYEEPRDPRAFPAMRQDMFEGRGRGSTFTSGGSRSRGGGTNSRSFRGRGGGSRGSFSEDFPGSGFHDDFRDRRRHFDEVGSQRSFTDDYESELRDYGYSQRDRHGSLSPPPRERDRHFERRSLSPYGHGYPPSEGSMHGSARFDDRYEEHNADRFSRDTECQSDSRDSRRDHKDRPTEEKFRPHEKRSRDRDERRVRSRDSIPGQSPQSSEYSSHASPAGNRSRSLSPRDKSRDKDRSSRPATPPTPTRDELPQNSRGGQESPMDYETSQWNYGKYPDLRSHIKREGHEPTELGNRKYDIDRGSAKSEQLSQKSHRTKHSDVDVRTRHGKYDSMDSMEVEKSVKSEVVVHKTGDRPSDVESQRKLQRQYSRSSTGSHGSRSKNVSDAHGDNCDTDKTSKGERTKALLCDERIVKHTKDYDKQRQSSLHKDKNSKSKDDSGSSSDTSSESSNDNSDAEEGKEEVAKGASSDLNKLQSKKQQLLQLIKQLDETGSASDGDSQQDEEGKRLTKKPRLEDVFDLERGPKLSYRKVILETARALEEENKDVQQHSQQQLQMSQQQIIQLSETQTQHPKETKPLDPFKFKPIDSTQSFRKQMEARRKEMEKKSLGRMSHHQVRRGHGDNSQSKSLDDDLFDMGPENSPKDIPSEFLSRKRRLKTTGDLTEQESLQAKRSYRLKRTEDIFSSSGDEGDSKQSSTSKSPLRKNLDSNLDMLSRKSKTPLISLEGDTAQVDVRRKMEELRQRRVTEKRQSTASADIHAWSIQEARLEYLKRDFPLSLPLPSFALQSQHSLSPKASPKSISSPKIQSPQISPGIAKLQSPPFSPGIKAIQMFQPLMNLTKADDSVPNATPTDDKIVSGSTTNAESLAGPVAPPMDQPLILPGTTQSEQSDTVSVPSGTDSLTATSTTAASLKDKPGDIETPMETENTEIIDASSVNVNDTAAETIIKTSPAKDSDNSDLSDLETPNSPNRPSLEERIRALDEKLSMASSLQSSVSLSTSTRTLDSSTPPTVTPIVDYNKYRIRKRGDSLSAVPMVPVTADKVEPSDIVKTLLSRSSIFDQDSRRLEQIHEKYEPKDNMAKSMVGENNAVVGSMAEPTEVMLQQKPGFRTKGAAKELPNLTQAAAQPLPGTRVPSLASSSPVTPMSTSSVSTPSTPLTPSTPATPGGACKPQTSAGMTAPGWKPVTDYAALKAAAQQQQQQLQIQTPPTVPQVMSTPQQQPVPLKPILKKDISPSDPRKERSALYALKTDTAVMSTAPMAAAASSALPRKDSTSAFNSGGDMSHSGRSVSGGTSVETTAHAGSATSKVKEEPAPSSNRTPAPLGVTKETAAMETPGELTAAPAKKDAPSRPDPRLNSGILGKRKANDDSAKMKEENKIKEKKPKDVSNSAGGLQDSKNSASVNVVKSSEPETKKPKLQTKDSSNSSSSSHRDKDRKEGGKEKKSNSVPSKNDNKDSTGDSSQTKEVVKKTQSSSSASSTSKSQKSVEKKPTKEGSAERGDKKSFPEPTKKISNRESEKKASDKDAKFQDRSKERDKMKDRKDKSHSKDRHSREKEKSSEKSVSEKTSDKVSSEKSEKPIVEKSNDKGNSEKSLDKSSSEKSLDKFGSEKTSKADKTSSFSQEKEKVSDTKMRDKEKEKAGMKREAEKKRDKDVSSRDKDRQKTKDNDKARDGSKEREKSSSRNDDRSKHEPSPPKGKDEKDKQSVKSRDTKNEKTKKEADKDTSKSKQKVEKNESNKKAADDVDTSKVKMEEKSGRPANKNTDQKKFKDSGDKGSQSSSPHASKTSKSTKEKDAAKKEPTKAEKPTKIDQTKSNSKSTPAKRGNDKQQSKSDVKKSKPSQDKAEEKRTQEREKEKEKSQKKKPEQHRLDPVLFDLTREQRDLLSNSEVFGDGLFEPYVSMYDKVKRRSSMIQENKRQPKSRDAGNKTSRRRRKSGESDSSEDDETGTDSESQEDSEDNWGRGSPRKTVKRSQRKTGETKTNRMKKPILDSSSDEDSDKEEENSEKSADSSSDLESETVLSRVSKKSTSSKEKGKQDPAPKSNKVKKKPVPKKKTEKGKSVGFTTDSDSDVSIKATVKSTTLRKQKQSIWTSDEDTDSNADEEKESPKVKPLHETSESEDTEIDLPKVSKGKKAVAKSTKKQAKPMAVSTEDSSGIDEFSLPSTKSSKEKLKVGDYFSSESEETDDGAASKKHAKKSKAGKMDETKANIFKKIASNKDTPSKSEEQPQSEDESMKSPKKTPKKTKALKKMIGKKEPIKETTKEAPVEVKTEVKSEEDSDEEINKKKATKTPTKGGKMFEKKMDEKKANIFKKIAANKEAAKKVKAKRESTTESEEIRGEDKLTDQNESSKDSDTKLSMSQQIKAEKPFADSGLPTTQHNKESKSSKGEREEGKEAFIATMDASKKTVKGKKEAQQGSKVGKVESKHPRLSETQPTVQKSAESGEPSNANLLENVVQGSKPDAKPGDETVAKKDEERKKKKKKQKTSVLKDDMTENEHEQVKATQDNEPDVSGTVEQGLKDQSAKQDHGDFKIKVEKESSPVVEKQSDDDRLENVPIESVAETVEIQTECGQDIELPKPHETSKEEKGEEADSVNDLEVPIGSPKKAQRVASKNKAKKGTVGKDGEKSDTEPKLSDANKRNKAPPKENAQRNIKSDPDDSMGEVSSKSQSEPVQKSSLDLIFDEITRESATMSADEGSQLEAASTPGKAKPRRKAARQGNSTAIGDDSQQGKVQTQEAPPEQSANETSTVEAATDDSDSPRSKRGRRTKPKVYSQDFITTLPRVSRTPSPKAASPRATRQGSAASPKAALTPSKTQPPPKAAGTTPVKSEKLVRGKKEKETEKSGETDKETATETKSMSVFDWQDSPDSSPIPPMRVQKTSVSESSSEVTPGGEQADKAKKSRGVRSGVKKKSDTQNSETDSGREKDEPILDPVTGLFRDKEGRVCPGYGVSEEEDKSQEADENSLNSNELELSQPTAESIAEDACAVSALLAMSDDIVPTPSAASVTPSSNQATAIEDVSQPAPSQGLVKVPEPAQTKQPAVSTENPTPVATVTSAAPIVLSNIDKVIDQVSKGEFEDSDYDVNSELYQSRMNSRRRSSDVRHLSGDGPRTPQTPQHVPAHLRSPPHIPHPLTSPQALHMDTHAKPSEKEVDTVRSSVEAGEPYVQSPTGLMMSPTYHYSHEKMPALPIKTDVHMGVVQGAPHAMGQVERSPTGQVIERVPNPSISVATSQAPGPVPKHPTSKGMPEYQKGLPSQGYWDHTTMGMPQFMQGRPPVSSEGKPQGEGFPGFPAGIHPQRPPVGEPQSSSSHLSPSARGPQQHPPTWPPATQGHLHNQSLDARIPTPAQRAGTKEAPPVSQPADIRPLTPSQRARQEARGVVDAQHQAQYRRSPERPPQQKPPHQEFRAPVTSAAHAESVPSHHQPHTSTNATHSAPPTVAGGQFSPRVSTPGSSQHPPPPARGQPMHHLAEQQRRGTPGHGRQTPEVQGNQTPQGQDGRGPMSETMQMRQQPSSPRAQGHGGVAQETVMYRQPVSVAQALSHHYPPGMYPPGMLHATPGGSAPPAQSPHSLQQASELRAVLNRPSLIAQHQAQLQQQLYVRPPLHHQVESTQSPGGVKNLSPVVGQGAVGTHTTKEGRVAPPPNNQPIESRVRMSQPGGPYGEMRVTQEDGRIVTLPSAFATPNGGRLGLVDARAELKQRTAAHPSVAHPDPRAPMAAHLPSEFLMQHGGMMPYPHTSLAGHIGVPPHLDPRIVMAGGQHHPELMARQGPPMIPTVVAQHHLAALQEAQSRTPDSQPISRPPSQFELPNQHSSSPVYSSAQAAVPPHMAHIPNMAERAGGLELPQHPDNLLSLLNKYPVMWQGMLGLKNDSANVQMHWVAGNDKLVGVSLPHMTADGLPCILRIAQRMRLEPSQLDGVARRMEKHEDYCMMLALPMGRDHADVISQTHGLKTGFIQYLQQKQAAGIVNVPAPGSTQPAYVVHIFPPCEFSQGNLARMSPDLLQNIRDMAHLLIVIATV